MASSLLCPARNGVRPVDREQAAMRGAKHALVDEQCSTPTGERGVVCADCGRGANPCMGMWRTAVGTRRAACDDTRPDRPFFRICNAFVRGRNVQYSCNPPLLKGSVRDVS